MKTTQNNVRYFLETSRIFQRSLVYQIKEFFQNSTLHGVRYIAESGRPLGEKFMWFCVTSVGAVTALVIIMSLWEKFQTNPTITGLDTDFHNQRVVFPTTVVCPEAPYDDEKAHDVANTHISNFDTVLANKASSFLEMLTTFTFQSMKEAHTLAQNIPKSLMKRNLRYWAFQAHASCKNFLLNCKYRDESIKCCSHFDLVYTEHGMCFAFNSRYKSTEDADIKTSDPYDLYETDKKWALFFVPNSTSRVYIFSHEEYFGMDFKPQIEWTDGQSIQMRISKKNTYTTDDARQLTIAQRKCIFNNEIKLRHFPDDYTISSCSKECRMLKAIKMCNCNPSFYKPTQTIRMCGVDDLLCLFQHRHNITNIADCLHCELSCSKTDFNIEKLIKNMESSDNPGVLIEFLTWPIVRYKREVLFGWVDLLVSFGGIASLFLGFSLLSGVEIIYYFTLRACCMVYKNRQELYEIEEKIQKRPPPLIDLSLKFKRDSIVNMKVHLNDNRIDYDNEKLINKGKLTETKQQNELSHKRRKADKGYYSYSKGLFRQSKVNSKIMYDNTNWHYLP